MRTGVDFETYRLMHLRIAKSLTPDFDIEEFATGLVLHQ
jgi:hypothetical protein